jgi:protein phosphatase
MNITLPELSLIALVGPSGAGKSTFARAHFRPTEVLSSDGFRAMISNDENNQSVSTDAFEAMHLVVSKRLRHGRLTVVDATHLQEAARRPLIQLAKEHHVLPVAIVFDVPLLLCLSRAAARGDRSVPPAVVRQQHNLLHRVVRDLEREGFRRVFILRSPEEIEAATIERVPLHCDRRFDRGPFDIIGDVHGCGAELMALLERLGYTGSPPRHPDGRRVLFLGDLVDRGPAITHVLRLAMDMVEAGSALCVPGNHEMKLLRKLNGRDVKVSHGLAETLQQLEPEPPEFITRLRGFLDGLVPHYVLDGGKLVVAHAGLKQSLQGRASGSVRDFALYGETTGETDQYGLPVRYKWAEEYRGDALVVYGHTPVPEPEWLNNTLCVDTGCVYGGRLTALRYPERELVWVPAAREYCTPARPFLPPGTTAPGAPGALIADDLLDMEDVLGKRVISTRLIASVTVHEDEAMAALEALCRFGVDPRWLIYLPPTMSPSETSRRPELLEHPDEAFAYYRDQGVAEVICQEKHMGSRAIVVVCRDPEVARRRFGDTSGLSGICYSRTGRRFFDPHSAEGSSDGDGSGDAGSLEAALIDRVRRAVTTAGLWQELETDWLCLDCELMPWSLKAQELLRVQYAAVGAAGRAALAAAVEVLGTATSAQAPVGDRPELVALRDRTRERRQLLDRYVAAYRRYCWPVQGLSDLRLAPFHLLASEGRVHTDRDHLWHMQLLARLVAADASSEDGAGVLCATPHRVVALGDAAAVQQATAWWQDLTERGGEGLVVKPLSFIARGPRGLVQPAIKCRGPEYLRIIYGPEYSRADNLARLRSRGLSHKRTLALRELALGIEGLERFVRREPLRRVHECVLGVLALESDPVDPRL